MTAAAWMAHRPLPRALLALDGPARWCGAVVDTLKAANEQWQLPVDRYVFRTARYEVGMGFERHTDYNPAATDLDCITHAASLQLSNPATYTGGDLVLHLERDLTAPRTVGSLVTFTGNVEHTVTPVTAGVRLAAVVFAVYGTVAQAEARGWPQRWLRDAC